VYLPEVPILIIKSCICFFIFLDNTVIFLSPLKIILQNDGKKKTSRRGAEHTEEKKRKKLNINHRGEFGVIRRLLFAIVTFWLYANIPLMIERNAQNRQISIRLDIDTAEENCKLMIVLNSYCAGIIRSLVTFRSK